MSASTAAPAKPWSVAVFESRRSHLTDFIKKHVLPLLDEDSCCRIVVRAPVKSGKREMVEYLAMRDHVRGSLRVHAFISSWHRVADAEQRAELEQHNLHVFSITTRAVVERAKAWIAAQIAAGKQVVLHLDECDHGSGKKHMLSELWKHIRSDDRVTNLLYSATPEEVLFSGEVDDTDHQAMVDQMIQEGHHIRYTPPPGYCGPARFLDAGLVFDAKPFFRKEGDAVALTAQAKKIISDMRAAMAAAPERNIIVLRLSYAVQSGTREEMKDNKAIYTFLRNLPSFAELEDFIVVVDKAEQMEGVDHGRVIHEKIQWSNPHYWRAKTRGEPILVVIDQTSSRSTEWSCHHRIFATHDYRNELYYSVISQAQERVNHYEQKYGGFQPIRVYGHRKTFELSADRIDYENYFKNAWKMRKVDRRQTGGAELYEIKDWGTGQLHPTFRAQYTEDQAVRILQDIGSYVVPAVSARVIGSAKEVPIFTSEWYAVTKETWEHFATKPDSPLRRLTRREYQNPFVRSERRGLIAGKFCGYAREWAVFDYERDIKPNPGWGIGRHDIPRLVICYKGGVVGIAINYNTGQKRRVKTLKAYKSMYGPPEAEETAAE